MKPTPKSGRMFEVECECGAEFRVGSGPVIEAPPPEGFLVQLTGRCPQCGLRLEEIVPPGAPPRPGPEARSRA